MSKEKEDFPFQGVIGGTFYSLQAFWNEFDKMQRAWFWIRHKKMQELASIRDPKAFQWLMKWDLSFRQQMQQNQRDQERQKSIKQQEMNNKINGLDNKIINLQEELKQKEAKLAELDQKKEQLEQKYNQLRRVA
jgi:tRNA A37 N6-isopentenylltransferase MiaA